LSDAETVIVIVPCESGSGKFGVPCERMQAVNLTPAVPRLVEMVAPIPDPGGTENAPELLAPLAGSLEVVPRLAIDGAFDPPPQPDTTTARLASPAANTAPGRATRREFIPSVEQKRLKQT
jgi:hypothetical protein